MRMMDWEAAEGERHAGLLGNLQSRAPDEDEVEGDVRFGAVGAAEVRADDDVLVVIAPQSMVGASIYEPLAEMVAAAEAQVCRLLGKDGGARGPAAAPPARAHAGPPLPSSAAQGTAVVLLNPLLQDRPSSGGVMGVRGRAERIDFAKSFREAYHFRLVYSQAAGLAFTTDAPTRPCLRPPSPSRSQSAPMLPLLEPTIPSSPLTSP